jgi:putative aldouronate transport system substrate-binding protein
MRKLLFIIISFLLTAGMIWAAGQTEDQEDGDRMEVTVARYVDGPVSENSYAEQYIENLFPDIDFQPIPLQRATWEQQLNIKVAGGDIPDVIFRTNIAGTKDYVKQGILAEVPYSSIKQYAPNLFQAMKDFGTVVFLSAYVDGKNYGVPIVNETQTFPFTDGIRTDWMEAVGITDMPETVEDLGTIFKRFTENDPDGNGKDDTYGFSVRAKDSLELIFPNIWGAFGVLPGGWMKQPDNTVKYGATTDNLRGALEILNEWYEAGYMDPEFITTDWALLKEKWNNGLIGYIPCSTWYRLMPTGENYDQLKAVNPDAGIGMVPAVTGPEGSYGYLGWGKATGSWAFGIHLENNMDKMNKIISVIDKVSTDPEVHGNLYYGKEGEHWQRGESGAAEFIPPYNETQKRGPLGTFFHFVSAPPMSVQKQFWREDYDSLTQFARDRNFEPEKQYTWLVQLSTETNQLLVDLQPMYREWIVQFITGEKDLSSDWNAYIEEIMDAGFDQINNEASEYYQGVADIIDDIESKIK